MIHLDICNTSYDKKKGQEPNLQFDSRPRNVRNRFDFRAYRWRATHCWKALDKSYNFSLDLVPIRGLSTKLQPCSVTGVPTMAISGLPFRSLETKIHLDVTLVEGCRVYYIGEGGGFPQIRAVVNLVSPKSLVVCPSTKCDLT